MTSTPSVNRRLGPIELTPGVTPVNAVVKLLGAFVGIGALSGIAILQSYIFNAHLHIPRGEQGTLAGNLAFWSEVVGLLLFFPFGIAADRIGRRPVLTFGFVLLARGADPKLKDARDLTARQIAGMGSQPQLGAVLEQAESK